jgi:hypothetical protein
MFGSSAAHAAATSSTSPDTPTEQVEDEDAPEATAADNGEVLWEGWLEKAGGNSYSAKFQSRYFVLYKTRLEYWAPPFAFRLAISIDNTRLAKHLEERHFELKASID